MAQAGRVTVTEPFKASWLPRLTANIQGGWEEARRAGPWPGVAAPRQRQWGSEARFLFRRSRSEAAAAAATGNDRDSSAPSSVPRAAVPVLPGQVRGQWGRGDRDWGTPHLEGPG